MDGVDNDPGHGETPEAPPPVELLADLQAGLLDDEAAAGVRRQVRTDPRARERLQALDQVRHDIRGLGAAPAAADAPANVIARISTALRSAPPPVTGSARGRAAHAARPSGPPLRAVAAVAGLAAATAVVVLGTAALVNAPAPPPGPPTTAQHITVSPSARTIPLSDAQILALLDRPPDYGSLSTPSRRASCLNGLGYPASAQILGAAPIAINGYPGVLLVLRGDTPGALTVLAVAPTCNAADTGLLADTVVVRP